MGVCAFMAGNLFKKVVNKPSAQDEIMNFVEDENNSSSLETSQREMINNIFLFDDITAGDIMTHRTDIEAVEISSSISDVVDLAVKEGFSRIPVYNEDLDNIVGIINIKDLLKLVGTKISADDCLKDYVRKPFFVPETISCVKLFKQMKDKRVQLAVVVDEYGGTAGIVSMEDILESIVGNIQDEYDDEEKEYEKTDDKTYIFDGSAEIEILEKVLGVKIPQGDYDTVAGFVINLLGFVPETVKKDDVISAQYENFVFTVLKVEERRIEQIKVEIN